MVGKRKRSEPQPATPKKKVATVTNIGAQDEVAALIARVGAAEEEEEAELENDESDADRTDDEDYANGADDDDRASDNGRAETRAVQTEGGFEAYFEQASRRVKTSNNTLSKLAPLSRREYLDLVGRHTLSYAAQSDALVRAHRTTFEEWSVELEEGFTVCLHGYGSKKLLIEEMVAQCWADVPHVIVNGYHPRADLRSICTSITQGLGETGTDVDAVLRVLDARDNIDLLLLVILNIDGEGLRVQRAQIGIARLLAHPKVRLLCSVDHVKAALMWSTAKLASLRLLYHDATTFVPYDAEIALQPDVFAQRQKLGALTGERGIRWILQTLSHNARAIFRILLVNQIDTAEGMESNSLYQKASEAFAVSNSTAFNAQLGEFLDHEIIVVGREAGIGEVYRIPFEQTELVKLLEDIDAEE